MWNWTPVTISPDGGGYCGGVSVTASSLSESLCESYVTAGIYLIVDALSESEVESNTNITGWGTRSGLNECECESVLDIGRGLIVINESGIITSNTNVIRFLGSTLYSDATLNKNSDATVSSDSSISIDGGDSPIRTDAQSVDGGDSINGNREIDGGSA